MDLLFNSNTSTSLLPWQNVFFIMFIKRVLTPFDRIYFEPFLWAFLSLTSNLAIRWRGDPRLFVVALWLHIVLEANAGLTLEAWSILVRNVRLRWNRTHFRNSNAAEKSLVWIVCLNCNITPMAFHEKSVLSGMWILHVLDRNNYKLQR